MQEIPDKLYFKIGEVAALLELKTHVLRYWETEFTALQPVKSRTNQRLYRRKDVETALLIKDLLYRQGFTIAGARQKLQAEKRVSQSSDALQRLLLDVRSDLQHVRDYLAENNFKD